MEKWDKLKNWENRRKRTGQAAKGKKEMGMRKLEYVSQALPKVCAMQMEACYTVVAHGKGKPASALSEQKSAVSNEKLMLGRSFVSTCSQCSHFLNQFYKTMIFRVWWSYLLDMGYLPGLQTSDCHDTAQNPQPQVHRTFSRLTQCNWWQQKPWKLKYPLKRGEKAHLHRNWRQNSSQLFHSCVLLAM